MSLVSMPVELDSNPPQVKDRKRNKVHPRTLNTHFEAVGSNYRILDLTNKNLEFPPVIASFSEYDEEKILDTVKKYMLKKRYTKVTVSYLSVKGMKFIS